MSCLDEDIQDIDSSCARKLTGGIENAKAWVVKRSVLDYVANDADPLQPNLVTSISVAVGSRLSTINGKGNKKLFDQGFDAVISDSMSDYYAHVVDFFAAAINAAEFANLQTLTDVVVITENKDKGDAGNAAFYISGLQNGLWATAMSMRKNTSKGTTSVNLASLPEQEEKYPVWVLDAGSYQDTIDLLNLLESVQ